VSFRTFWNYYFYFNTKNVALFWISLKRKDKSSYFYWRYWKSDNITNPEDGNDIDMMCKLSETDENTFWVEVFNIIIYTNLNYTKLDYLKKLLRKSPLLTFYFWPTFFWSIFGSNNDSRLELQSSTVFCKKHILSYNKDF